MFDSSSESDLESMDPSSSPISSIGHVYFVQSPSRDSQDDDKSSTSTSTSTTTTDTQIYNSPMPSPARSSSSSYCNYSTKTSSSEESAILVGDFQLNSARRSRKYKRINDKKWRHKFDPIEEEEEIEIEFDFDQEKGVSWKYKKLFIATVFWLGIVFGLFCLAVWGASKPYTPYIRLQNLTLHKFYLIQGSDYTGVPTKILSVKCSMSMSIYNPATFFGIHLSSNSINLMYSQVVIATGQLNKYYLPRKGNQIITLNLQGHNVPMYGAGPSLAKLHGKSAIRLMLQLEVVSQGLVVGNLVKSNRRRHIACSLYAHSRSNKTITIKQRSCIYD